MASNMNMIYLIANQSEWRVLLLSLGVHGGRDGGVGERGVRRQVDRHLEPRQNVLGHLEQLTGPLTQHVNLKPHTGIRRVLLGIVTSIFC